MSAADRTDQPSLSDEPGAPAPDRTPAAPPPGAEKGAGDAVPAEPSDQHPQFVGTGVFWGLVVGVVLAVVVIVFASQNTQSAEVDVIAWKWTAPIFVIVLISLIIGIVLDEIVGLLYRSRRRRRLAEQAELRRLRGRR